MQQNVQVFISFKNLDSNGKQTRDSELAREIHEFLSNQGLEVFFSNVSLEKLGIAGYKKAIDNALDSARVLVAVGTSGSNLDSQWVRYEWDSFTNDILSGMKPDGRVFSYVEGLSITELPRTLRQSQVFLHGTGSMEKLYNFICNALGLDTADITGVIEQITSFLKKVVEANEVWRTGVVETWLAKDINCPISRIVTDWDRVSPSSCQELNKQGWKGNLHKNGMHLDKPRIWKVSEKKSELETIAEEVLTVHRILQPSDQFSKLVFTKLPQRDFSTPPWFIPQFLGGDLSISCKQCDYENDDYDHYGDQIPPEECPQCGLGRNDWFTYNFQYQHTLITCKKCNYQTDIYGTVAPENCPQCGWGRNSHK